MKNSEEVIKKGYIQCIDCNKTIKNNTLYSKNYSRCDECGILLSKKINEEVKNYILTLNNKKIKCPKCKEEIFAIASKCKHCGSKVRPIKINRNSIRKNIEEKYYSESKKKKKTILGILLFIMFVYFLKLYVNNNSYSYSYKHNYYVKPIKNDNSEITTNISKVNDCYNIGYKFGSCVARSMRGLTCKPGTDITIPYKCKGLNSTARGTKAGIASETH